jgi:hypothetical protein
LLKVGDLIVSGSYLMYVIWNLLEKQQVLMKQLQLDQEDWSNQGLWDGHDT